MTTPQKIIVGKINGLYGIQGGLKVFSYTDPPTNIFHYTPWQLKLVNQPDWQVVDVIKGRTQGQVLIVYLVDRTTRETAAQLLGAEIAVERQQLPAIGEDDYYWTDLIGLTVYNHQQIILGRVDQLLTTGLHDILVIHGEREYLIPFVRQITINEVQLSKGVIYVNWEIEDSTS